MEHQPNSKAWLIRGAGQRSPARPRAATACAASCALHGRALESPRGEREPGAAARAALQPHWAAIGAEAGVRAVLTDASELALSCKRV